MATWIVHLRIAENLLEQAPGLDESAFALGNIAPDSGIPDEKWEHFDPPPKVTHFQISDHPHYRSEDLRFYREHLLPLRGSEPDAALFSIRLGYFFHLVTDNLWYQQVGRPAVQRWRADFASDAAFWDEIKGDWYGLDHAYVRAHPGSLFWRVFVHCRYERDDLPFLPPEAVHRQLAYIQDWYRSDDAGIRAMLARPFEYLNQGQVDAFIEGASRKLAEIYRSLWVESAAVDGKISALEMLENC
ncbi:zinc dependent phospholipase C [Longilinea arvoryzae]|uniref:Zinc dependent phospholipase C n=1 Tax=Longilinea arvoryzae TaxID=360412 RepID=A0A0K8MYD2_9CHLR|nr:zinc dependent phospholipase C family protein [Longilinea arvoryzae]GAP16051.1 zinc dependent phospholipase C [Longilinea arvoryzae]